MASYTPIFSINLKNSPPPDPLVFYPGSWSDKFLERYFDRLSVIHLDKIKVWFPRDKFVQSVYQHVPFANETFDMMFIRDKHADEADFNSLLNAVKTDGFVVFDAYDSCGPYTIGDAFENERLRFSPVPSFNTASQSFQVFQKIASLV